MIDGIDVGAPWHQHSTQETAELLKTHLRQGLTAGEAQERLAQYGPNELQERPRPTFWHMLIAQFKEFLVLILIVSAIVSFFLGEYVEAVAIMTIVVLNAVLGVVQESKAEEALAALQKMAAPEAGAVRDGHVLTLPARELVPGDLVILETGNYVPADVRLLEAINLRIEEASLTGESVPVEKNATGVLPPQAPLGDRHNMAYMGTLVSYGRGRGLVIATGMHTQFGLIAEMIQSVEEEQSPLQAKLEQLGKWLGVGCLAVCAIVFGVGMWEGRPALEMFLTAVSLAIAAVPEGLPAVVTICLALGMQQMIRRHALIRKLPAVETLGSATAICSDKTGTLTQNEMTAVQAYADSTLLDITGEGYRPEGELREEDGQRAELRWYPAMRPLLQGGLLCSDAHLERTESDNGGEPIWRIVGDPTEGALVVGAAKADLWRERVEQELPRVAEIPFDSERKRMTTIHRVLLGDTESKEIAVLDLQTPYVAYVKGAPDVVIDLCSHITEDGRVWPLDGARRERILEINEALASNARRVLGIAYRPLDELPPNPTSEEVEQELIFVGLVGMIDPARPEAKEAIGVARRAGIRTIMITGDYPNTAAAIAREIGLIRHGDAVLSGADIDQLSDEEFAAEVERTQVYARVSPQHKVRIVEALRRQGHVVAMTGDGVNDAPALKRADIGVAMGITGTDVSKETADMVLTDDNFASIVAAVEEGRIIYANIRKFVYYLLSCNMGEIFTIFLATLFRWDLPLTAIQLLWLNLLTDGAPALALGLEAGEPDIMRQPPRAPDEPVVNRPMRRDIAVQTVAITAATLGAFLIGKQWFPNNLAAAQTMAFATLSTSELLRAYTARSERYSVFRIGLWSNKVMQMSVAASIALLLAVIYVPFLDPIFNTTFLGIREWLAMAPLILLPATTAEISKLWGQRSQRRALAVTR
jgi:Ca2+-transporting ATPase